MMTELEQQNYFIQPMAVNCINRDDIIVSGKTNQETKTHQIVKAQPRICCDCGCMIDDINEVCERFERKFVPRRRSRNRLVRQYTAPARCR